MRSAANIEVFADITCPFTHVGLRRLKAERAARGLDIPIRVRAWPLEWVNGQPLAADLVAAEIVGLQAEVATGLFAGFDASTFPRTTIPALGLAAAAYELDNHAGEAVSLLLRDALFEEGRDLNDEAEVRSIGHAVGVELPELDVAQAAVRADWQRGQHRGVLGSPHFFVDGRNWFCPSLRIRHDGPDFEISVDVEALAGFYEAALG